MTDNQQAGDDEHQGPSPAAVEATEATEPRPERLRRHRHRARLYMWAFGLVALIVMLIALALANTRQVKLSWLFGTSHASLVWIILASAVLGWLLGILTGIVFRLRTRRRPRPGGRTTAAAAPDSSTSDPHAAN